VSNTRCHGISVDDCAKRARCRNCIECTN
jgi:hypothetical protein